MLSSMGRVKSKVLARHGSSAHKLALHPEHCHVFYSSGEDCTVRRYDIRRKNAGAETLLTVHSCVPSRVRTWFCVTAVVFVWFYA